MESQGSPIARRVAAMHESGVSFAEIGRRINRSPERVSHILEWTEVPREGLGSSMVPSAMARRVLALRDHGETHERIAERFRRSPDHIRRVEAMAQFQLGGEFSI